MGCTAEAAKCVVHLGRSYPREDPSCSGPVPTAKTTLNPAHVRPRPRPERRALHNEPRLDDPSCSGPVPTAKTTLNPAHVRPRPRPERRALHNEPQLDDTIKPLARKPLARRPKSGSLCSFVRLRGGCKSPQVFGGAQHAAAAERPALRAGALETVAALDQVGNETSAARMAARTRQVPYTGAAERERSH